MNEFLTRILHWLFFLLFNGIFIPCLVYSSECPLPEKCQFRLSYGVENTETYVKGNKVWTIICDVNNNEFEFTFKASNQSIISDQRCDKGDYYIDFIILRWTSLNEIGILEKQMNLSNLNQYMNIFMFSVTIELMNLKGIDIEILDEKYFSSHKFEISAIELTSCQLDFYHKRMIIKSCQDFIHLNITKIQSIFQLYVYELLLRNVEYKEKICPLLFMN